MAAPVPQCWRWIGGHQREREGEEGRSRSYQMGLGEKEWKYCRRRSCRIMPVVVRRMPLVPPPSPVSYHVLW